MDIEQEILSLKQRNLRVETDKAWEKSFTRRLFIVITTYIVALVWLLLIGETIPFLKAFIPSLGYILSTLSLPFIKNWWVKNHHKT